MSALRELTHLGAVVADPVGRARVVACVINAAAPRRGAECRHATWSGGHCQVQQKDGSWRLGEDGQPVEAGVGLRLAATFAIHQARAVADFAHAEAGATAIFESGPFERDLRGLYAVTQQVQACKIHFGTVGQQLTGLSPNPCFF